MSKTIRIGGASGYWGDSDMALPQFLHAANSEETRLDYIVFDYLAEITMSIMARQRAKDPATGYATDFVSSLKPHLKTIAAQKVKILSNAGGVNPRACGEAVRALVRAAGLDLKVTVIEGDDLLARAADFATTKEMFSGEAFPPADKLASINAYFGAFPIAEALTRGADIVITGRSVDSAVTLAACIHAFNWSRTDVDKLAAGSLAGHILECGAQATGGNFTDWRLVADSLWNIGYPIAEVSTDGTFTVTKPADTGGAVTIGTVGEQMLYEIGDPQAYMLPDVACDFSDVRFEQVGDTVRVTGARGRPAPDTYKVSATYEDGFRAGAVWFFYGEEAADKARLFADSALKRARHKLRALNAPDYDDVLVELMGDESLYGSEARKTNARDVALKVAVKHRDQRAAGLILKELTGHGLAGPPGLSGFAGARPSPSPVVRLFSFLTPKANVPIRLILDSEEIALGAETGQRFDPASIRRPTPPDQIKPGGDWTDVPLIRLAYARSGDKGNHANIGVLPRDPRYADYIWTRLSEPEIARRFAHYLDPKHGRVERFFMPGTGAMNILLHNVLGGGGAASLRNDPQAKGYSQILLQTPIPIPRTLAEQL